MTDISRRPPSQHRQALERDDLEKVRAAARAAYQGAEICLSDAVRKRDQRRAEREREAAKLHYFGKPQVSR
ncbi:MAG TPA: hypothetical protein VF651_00855 [Gammaproteobacteria bacterium]|nr:hypothetical protein [Gammaproteobacteria bacterium]